MLIILYAVGTLLLPTLALSALVYLVLLVIRKRPERYWRRALYLHLVLIPIHAFLLVPGGLGYVGANLVTTRDDEQDYAGPRIDAQGNWDVQTRVTLGAEEEGLTTVDPEVIAASEALGVEFESDDGTGLRAFLVPPLRPDPLISVVMVHGLFRNAIELETVGKMFRRLGAEVLLLELRRHGGSESTGPFTFGLKESEDVEAAVKFLRERPGREDDPVVLFGVSLGTAAVALAAPRISNLAGVVLDAPMDSLLATANRMLTETRGRVPSIPNPFRALILRSLEFWSGFRMSEVQPIDALASLPADMPILLIGAGQDERMPPDSVSAIYETLRAPPGVKELWLCEGARHGHVWDEDLSGYEERIIAFMEQVNGH